jgi:hypothetical protein
MKQTNLPASYAIISFSFSLIVYLFSLFSLGVTDFPVKFLDSIFINSDSVLHSLFFQDIFIDKIDLSQWIFPHSFLFFPEFVIYLSVRLFFSENLVLLNFLTSILTYALVQIAFTFYIIKSYNIKIKTYGNLFLLLSLLNIILTTKYFALFYQFFLTPHFHVGTILTVLVANFIYKKYLDTQKYSYLLFTTILCIFFIISDPLFIIYFLIPSCVASLYIYRNKMHILYTLFSFFIATIISLLIYFSFNIATIPMYNVKIYRFTFRYYNTICLYRLV